MTCPKPLLVLLSLLLCSALGAGGFRTLTDTEGRQISAKVLHFDGSNVTLITSDNQRFIIGLSLLSDADQSQIREQFTSTAPQDVPQSASAPQLIPGEVLTLDFPNLLPMADNQPSKCEIRIPESYTADQSFPLLVWFSGGKGSARAENARGLVDFDKFIVVALPYPEGRLPRLAVTDGTIDDFWKYLRPMLDEVKKTVPNISNKVRIAGGSSSGAHLVGSGICQKWRGFSDYFTGYILHEGGYAPSRNYEAARRKHVLVVYGEKSQSFRWQQRFNEAIKDSRARITFVGIAEDGHGLSSKGRQHIRQWTDNLLDEL